MLSKLFFSALALAGAVQFCNAQTPGKITGTEQVLLPNGWKLSPAGHASLPLGDLPLNIQLSSSGKYLAVTNNGQSTQSVQLIDAKEQKILDTRVIDQSWYGLVFSDDEKMLYASGGNKNCIVAYPINNNKLGKADTIPLGKPWPNNKVCATGLVIKKDNSRLYAATKEDNCLYTINPTTKAIIARVKLPAEAYGAVLSPDEKLIYLSIWGGEEVVIYDTESQKITGHIKTGDHPNEILLNKKGSILFVANANDNSVSIIDTKTSKVLETVSTALYPTKLTGSTTNGLALSPNEKTLYIANADNNCLAVFDVSKPGSSQSMGFIPVGWYPTNIKTLGNQIFVSNGKGFTSMANPHGPQPIKKSNAGYQTGSTNSREEYIAGLFKGTLSIIDAPSTDQLKVYTKQVYANTLFTNDKVNLAEGLEGNPIPRKVGDKSPIKHVFYIIKENRTYDQVLGDISKGMGDSSLCIFPDKITPNQHALVNEFVLADNFYVDAEVSADGHNWSMGAYATDFLEKTWPTSYGKRGGNYGGEGEAHIANPRDGFIWDFCQRAGVTYRTYGEFADYGKTKLKSLKGHACEQSPGFNLDITDQVRYNAWAHDFDSLITMNAVPQFNSVRICNDHTSGQKKGKVSPLSAVADNDLAVGKFIEHLSHSPIWKESVVFILEDDAQNGPDHIDAHRSPVYVVGPYVKRNAVVHGMYSTSGVLRTMELILGLPPMSQYDAAAMPLYDCFTSTPDFTPFTVRAPGVGLDIRNIAVNESSKRSANFNLAEEDEAPDLDLNQVVWKYVKGEDSTMPAPKRSAFVILEKKKKHDGD
ncbi:MAG: bifunctional YncE family protein/alkaline phosphatase family protein [Bacteroidota bacterium]